MATSLGGMDACDGLIELTEYVGPAGADFYREGLQVGDGLMTVGQAERLTRALQLWTLAVKARRALGPEGAGA